MADSKTTRLRVHVWPKTIGPYARSRTIRWAVCKVRGIRWANVRTGFRSYTAAANWIKSETRNE